MELLEVTPFQNPKDTSDLAAEVIRCSAVKPGERFKELENFCRQQLLRYEQSYHIIPYHILRPEMKSYCTLYSSVIGDDFAITLSEFVFFLVFPYPIWITIHFSRAFFVSCSNRSLFQS